MKVKDRSCLKTLTTIAMLFFIVRLIMAFSDQYQDAETASKTFWEPVDMWLLLFSVFFTLLPDVRARQKQPIRAQLKSPI